MNIEAFRDYCLTKKSVTEEFPFDEETLVFKVLGKIFALTGLERVPHEVNLKCDPEKAIELREEYDGLIFGGYHMNKKHWNTIMIESLPNELITEMIDHSYELVVSKLPKKLRESME